MAEFSQEVWDAVRAEPCTPMRQHIWALAYEETLAREGVRAFVAGPPEQPLALAPFAVPATGSRRQTLLGAEDLWESIEVAAGDENALRTLAEGMAASALPLRFGHHPTDTQFLDHLRRAYRGRGRVLVSSQPARAMPRIDLDPTWIEPESHFSSRRRSDFRRMVRRAEAMGEVTFDILAPTEENLGALIEEAFAIEARNWKGRSGTSIIQNGRVAAFYRSYARKAMEAGILRLCFMRIDGVAAAMQYAVECEDRFWLIKVGYDDAYRDVSPGNLLLRETIRYAAQRQLKGFEFLGKEAEWTTIWAGGARPIATVRTYPYNHRGLAAFVADGIGITAKRLAGYLKTSREERLA